MCSPGDDTSFFYKRDKSEESTHADSFVVVCIIRQDWGLLASRVNCPTEQIHASMEAPEQFYAVLGQTSARAVSHESPSSPDMLLPAGLVEPERYQIQEFKPALGWRSSSRASNFFRGVDPLSDVLKDVLNISSRHLFTLE